MQFLDKGLDVSFYRPVKRSSIVFEIQIFAKDKSDVIIIIRRLALVTKQHSLCFMGLFFLSKVPSSLHISAALFKPLLSQ